MKLRNIVFAAALFAGATSMAGAAMAQTKVYIVNESRVMMESKLGKAMNQQLTADAQQAVEQLGLKTLKTEADTAVCLSKDGKPMTLHEVFQSMNLTAYDLTVDMLDVHAVSHFDYFLPSRLRESFLVGSDLQFSLT